MYFAHSTENPSREDWQKLPEHLVGVAELAEAFARAFSLLRLYNAGSPKTQ